MELISPISEETIRPYVGRRVCAVMHDGTYLMGTISNCQSGMLYFQGGVPGPGVVSTSAKLSRAQIKRDIKNKATISFFPFFGFRAGFAAGAISIALIAALFAFPFI